MSTSITSSALEMEIVLGNVFGKACELQVY